MRKVIVKKRQTLKALFKEEFPYLPFYLCKKLCEKKEIRADGKTVKEDAVLAPGTEVSVYYDEKKYPLFSAVYEDENVWIVDKKRGVPYEILTDVLQNSVPSVRPVHRLDTNTAGLIVYAKTEKAEKELLSAMRDRRVKKQYLCRVYGVPEKKHAILSDFLVKDEERGVVRIVKTPAKGALPVITEYEMQEDLGDGTAVLLVTLHTGRTHQIRAHLANCGHFVIGDGKYGVGEVNKRYGRSRQELTSVLLQFFFPKESELFYLSGKEFTIPARFYAADEKGDKKEGN